MRKRGFEYWKGEGCNPGADDGDCGGRDLGKCEILLLMIALLDEEQG